MTAVGSFNTGKARSPRIPDELVNISAVAKPTAMPPEQRNKEPGFGRRKPQIRKHVPTLGEIAADYQEAKFSHNTASTKSGRYYKLKSVILPELGHLPVDRLTRRRLDQYVNKRLATQLTAWIGPEIGPETNRVKKKLFRDVKLFFIPSSPLRMEDKAMRRFTNRHLWGTKGTSMILCIKSLHQFILVLPRNCFSSQGGTTCRRLAYLQPLGDGYRCHHELSMRPKT
jgi:hypothetical protein